MSKIQTNKRTTLNNVKAWRNTSSNKTKQNTSQTIWETFFEHNKAQTNGGARETFLCRLSIVDYELSRRNEVLFIFIPYNLCGAIEMVHVAWLLRSCRCRHHSWLFICFGFCVKNIYYQQFCLISFHSFTHKLTYTPPFLRLHRTSFSHIVMQWTTHIHARAHTHVTIHGPWNTSH